MTTTTLFISGASGFIAQHIIKLSIAKGYTVIGSVRSEAKGEKFQKLFGDKFSYEIVSDLEKEGAFEKALEKHPEVTVFLHTASPVVLGAEDGERDVINPAVNGTKNVFKAIKSAAPQITKVILTASIASIADLRDPKVKVDETTWNKLTLEEALLNPLDYQSIYSASKTIAEKAAWDFVKNEKPNFSLTTIHPVLVFGPQLIDEDAKTPNLSNSILTGLTKLKESDEVPSFSCNYVDVKDVAEAHIIAFENDGAGKRIILNAGVYSNQGALDDIHKNISELSSKFITGKPGVNTTIESEVNDEKSREFLGLKYVNFTDSIAATLKQYIKANNL